MKRIYTLVALSVVLVSTAANAQRHCTNPQYTHGDHHADLYGHDHWRPHTIDVRQLDVDSDRLARIARHLHDDAHQLSQDYHHSHTIESNVDQLDRLQTHMHDLLHDAARSSHPSSSLVLHLKRDLRQIKALMSRLYGELSHQAADGARHHDYLTIRHMRDLIARQAYPLALKMERELHGNAFHLHASHAHY